MSTCNIERPRNPSQAALEAHTHCNGSDQEANISILPDICRVGLLGKLRSIVIDICKDDGDGCRA